jgi:primosomal protein N' (replication factor Y)
MERVRLLVFNAVLGVLDYRKPEGMAVELGSVVIAPLGPRQILGIVWEAERLNAKEVPDAKLRPLLEVLPVPPLPAELRRLIEWTADYYCAPMSSVARMALASSAALRGGGTTTEYRLTGEEPARITPQRAAALDALQGEQASIRELAELAGVSEGVLRGMVGAGLLESIATGLTALPCPTSRCPISARVRPKRRPRSSRRSMPEPSRRSCSTA